MTFASLFRETEPNDMKKIPHKANVKLTYLLALTLEIPLLSYSQIFLDGITYFVF